MTFPSFMVHIGEFEDGGNWIKFNSTHIYCNYIAACAIMSEGSFVVDDLMS